MPCENDLRAMETGLITYKLNSTSTAEILATFAALRIVCSLHSLKLMPPSFPSSTYSTSVFIVSSTGVFGSTRAHSKRSRNFLPSRTRRHSSTLRRTLLADPSQLVLWALTPPLMEMMTFSASAGYLVKYSFRRWSELRSAGP